MLERERFARELAEGARIAHARFSDGRETLEVAYDPDVPFESATAVGVAAALTTRLRVVAERERQRRAAIAGPHRDDLTLTLDGRSLAAYGSQGQQRTAVLALKVAEYAVVCARAGKRHYSCSTTFFRRLDEERAAAFLAGIGEYEQAFVTATHMCRRACRRALGVQTVGGGTAPASAAPC